MTLSDGGGSTAQMALTLVIRFLDDSLKMRKGLLGLGRRLEIESTIHNSTDSALIIESCRHSPPGNPSFWILKENGDDLYPKQPAVFDVLPAFLILKAGENYTDTVDILELNKYEFVPRMKYRIQGTYVGGYQSIEDSLGGVHDVWSGRIRSNLIEFTYPD
jgi:hypothetical protein